MLEERSDGRKVILYYSLMQKFVFLDNSLPLICRRRVVFVDTDALPARESRAGRLVQNDIEAQLVFQVSCFPDILISFGISLLTHLPCMMYNTAGCRSLIMWHSARSNWSHCTLQTADQITLTAFSGV